MRRDAQIAGRNMNQQTSLPGTHLHHYELLLWLPHQFVDCKATVLEVSGKERVQTTGVAVTFAVETEKTKFNLQPTYSLPHGVNRPTVRHAALKRSESSRVTLT